MVENFGVFVAAKRVKMCDPSQRRNVRECVMRVLPCFHDDTRAAITGMHTLKADTVLLEKWSRFALNGW
jgi:hypothetical protein